MSGNVIQNESAAVMRGEPQAALPYACALHRWRFLIILVGAAIGVLGIIGLNRVVFDPDVLVYFDREMPERQALEAIEDRFGRTNEAVFVLRSREGSLLEPARLEGIRFLHARAQKLPGVLNVRSVLSLAGGPQLPATPEAIAKLRGAVARRPPRGARRVI